MCVYVNGLLKNKRRVFLFLRKSVQNTRKLLIWVDWDLRAPNYTICSIHSPRPHHQFFHLDESFDMNSKVPLQTQNEMPLRLESLATLWSMDLTCPLIFIVSCEVITHYNFGSSELDFSCDYSLLYEGLCFQINHQSGEVSIDSSFLDFPPKFVGLLWLWFGWVDQMWLEMDGSHHSH